MKLSSFAVAAFLSGVASRQPNSFTFKHGCSGKKRAVSFYCCKALQTKRSHI